MGWVCAYGVGLHVHMHHTLITVGSSNVCCMLGCYVSTRSECATPPSFSLSPFSFRKCTHGNMFLDLFFYPPVSLHFYHVSGTFCIINTNTHMTELFSLLLLLRKIISKSNSCYCNVSGNNLNNLHMLRHISNDFDEVFIFYLW